MSPALADEPYPVVPGLPAAERCLVMGVLNVTPDSFSDGGQWLHRGAAVERGLQLVAQGADLVDVGGESTRPGAARIELEEELRRVVEVVRDLAQAGVAVSVDTTRSAVARAAIDAGAVMVNDVSGGTADRDMLATIAAAGVPYVVMHSRGPSSDMQERAGYADVVADVHMELSARRDAATAAGIAVERLILDPGLGFAKTPCHNWDLLAHLGELVGLGQPLLVGASRKSFLGELLVATDGTTREPTDRDGATAAVSALVAHAGAWCVRVHDVPATADAVRVAAALRVACAVRVPTAAPAVAGEEAPA